MVGFVTMANAQCALKMNTVGRGEAASADSALSAVHMLTVHRAPFVMVIPAVNPNTVFVKLPKTVRARKCYVLRESAKKSVVMMDSVTAIKHHLVCGASSFATCESVWIWDVTASFAHVGSSPFSQLKVSD